MATNVCMGNITMCTFGLGPSQLVPTPKPILTGQMVAANIMDHVPMMNVVPFPLCGCPGNPVVAAATAAAFGVLTPAACIPNTVAPWAPGSPTVLLQNFPALNNTSTLACAWGGVITISMPGQFTHIVP